MKAESGGLITDPVGIANQLNNTFTNIISRYERSISTDNNSVLANHSTDMTCLKSFVDATTPPDKKFSIPQVNREFIVNQLSSLSTTVATGPDNISSRTLKCSGPLIADHLEKIYNKSITESVFHTQW